MQRYICTDKTTGGKRQNGAETEERLILGYCMKVHFTL